MKWNIIFRIHIIKKENEWNTKLVERLRKMAKDSNRSLNNYVETLLLDIVYHEPNDETIEALKEAKSGKKLESFNRSELEKLIASL